MEAWLEEVVATLGHAGVALLMCVENVFPPIPSEVVMSLAGLFAARGELSFPLVVAAGLAGSLAGAVLIYGAGYWLGRERIDRFVARHGSWVGFTPSDVDRAQRWFDRHSRTTVALGRLVPGVRSLVSLPAGVCRMPFWSFLAWSTPTSAIWVAALAAAGFWMGDRLESVQSGIRYVSWAVIGGLLLATGIYLVRQRRSRRASNGSPNAWKESP